MYMLALVIFWPHRSTGWMLPIATDGVAWSVCLSVCPSVTLNFPNENPPVMRPVIKIF